MKDVSSLSRDDIERLVHDLSVHHTELELQAQELRETQIRLQESLDKYQELYDFAPVGYLTMTDTGIVTEANLKCSELLGYSRPEIIGKRFQTYIAPSDQDTYHFHRMRLSETRAIDTCEIALVKRDGAQLFVLLQSRPLYDSDGLYTGCRTTLTDITDRRDAEQALAESEARVKIKLEAILAPEGDIGALNLEDVIDTQAVQALMDDFYALTEIGVGIIDSSGKILVATGWQEICTKFHREHPETCRHCVQSDTVLSSGIQEGRFKLYRCGNNMWDMATPIIVGGKHLGNIFLGQFLFEEESPDYDFFRSQARQYGFDEEAYLAALDNVPRWSRETVDRAMTFYAKLSGILSNVSYGNIKLARSLAEQRQLLNSLRESETRYRSLFDNMLDGFAYCRMIFEDGKPQDFVYLAVNDSFARLTGLKNVIGKRVTEIIPGIRESNPELFEIYGRVSLTGRAERFETFVESLGIWFSTAVYSTRKEHFVAVFDNITQRKEAEESLRQLLHFRESLIDAIPDPVFYKDVEGKYLGCNQAFASLLGLSKKNVVGKSDYEVVSRSAADLWRQKDQQLFDSREVQVFECSIAGPDGTERSLEHHTAPFFGPDGTLAGSIGVLSDITDRKRAEEALRESEQRYRATFDNAAVGMDLVDREGRFLAVNDTLAGLLGYSQQELCNLTIFDVTSPEDLAATREAYYAFIRGEINRYRLEKRYIRKDGSDIWTDLSVSAIRDREGNHVATVGVIVDISKRKQYEEARLRLATAVEQAAEAIVVSDTQGILTYVNPAFERTTGYSSKEAIGNNPRILKSGRHDSDFYKNMWEIISSGHVWSGHFINKKKDGTLFEEEATISPIKDDSGKIVSYVAVKRDVTREVSLQKQLLQAQKMEAVGTLAGGIAHDFNNLLQVVLGYSELLLSEKPRDEAEYADLQKIYQAARSGADLVRSLLTFSRRVEAQPVPMSLNDQIKQAAKLLRRTMPRMMDIQLELAEDLGKISGDPAQIEQIVMNLALNSRDAMGETGSLTIRTENVALDEESSKLIFEAKPGDYVLLSVSDTGHGMDKETAQHIFEPFYTTKELGRGTGLGLAMVYGIVKQHGGHVVCYSEVGSGATFNIYFPAISETSKPDSETAEELPASGTETVLLVDDEETVRKLGERILTKSGYHVVTAANGEEALAAYSKEKGRFDLVILDLIMPKMGGKDCLKELLKIDPRTRVLVSSGLSDDASTKDCLKLGAKGFVSKPFRLKQLLKHVRSCLDEA